MRAIKYASILIITTIAIACTFINDDDMDKDNTENCDTDTISYSLTITSVMNSNCVACHNTNSASAGINVDNYEGVKLAIEEGNFMAAIKHEKGAKAMPQGRSKLSDCTISQIQAWIDNGMINN